MDRLANNWSDEARAASLEVRRARARARARQAAVEKAWREFRRENPDATHVDWIIQDEKNLQEWRENRDYERWREENPNGTDAEWEKERAARNDAWSRDKKSKDQAQWEEQRKGRRRRWNEPFVENWFPREDDGAVVPSYYDEETEELIELPRDVWPDHLREDPGLKQGEVLDPHWGPYGPDAPYGYHDGTGEPREEPLYDANGYPIVPREPLRSRHGNSAEDYQSDEDWRRRSEDALGHWGRWGQKRKWMRKHAGLGEADWREYVRKKWGDEDQIGE